MYTKVLLSETKGTFKRSKGALRNAENYISMREFRTLFALYKDLQDLETNSK